MNLFIDSLLQYSALAEVIVDIQDTSCGEENRRKLNIQRRTIEIHGRENIIFMNLHTLMYEDVSQVHFDVSPHMLIVVTKIIGPLSTCVVP